MREWQVLFAGLDEAKRKGFVYGFVRFLLQEHNPATLHQHMSKRGTLPNVT